MLSLFHLWETVVFVLILFAAYMSIRELFRTIRPRPPPVCWFVNFILALVALCGVFSELYMPQDAQNAKFITVADAKMQYESLILGALIYIILIGVLVIINEAFCKAACLRNAAQVRREQEAADVELDARKPCKMERVPKYYTDAYYNDYNNMASVT